MVNIVDNCNKYNLFENIIHITHNIQIKITNTQILIIKTHHKMQNEYNTEICITNNKLRYNRYTKLNRKR